MADRYRVVHQQLTKKSILLDKIDRSQGNFERPQGQKATTAKQAVYVPYVSKADPTVKGYIDLTPTSEVLLHLRAKGVIAGLVAKGLLTSTLIDNVNTVLSTVSNAVFATGKLTVTGTKMVSLAPDVTRVLVTNPSGVIQTVTTFDSNSGTSLVIDAGQITGTPTTGWKVRVQANGKTSLSFTMA